MNKIISSLSIFVLFVFSVGLKAMDYHLIVVNDYPKDVSLYYTVKATGYGYFGESARDEKRNETLGKQDLFYIKLDKDQKLKKLEFVASGFHIPGAFLAGKLIGKETGGRRVIDLEEVKQQAKENGPGCCVVIRLDQNEEKKYKIVSSIRREDLPDLFIIKVKMISDLQQNVKEALEFHKGIDLFRVIKDFNFDYADYLGGPIRISDLYQKLKKSGLKDREMEDE